MKHITNDKGDIGVARVTADLINKGIPVFYPVNSTCPFDLLAYEHDKFLRVQVKYRKKHKGCVGVELARVIIKSQRVIHKLNDQVDILAIFCPDTDLCYYISTKDFDECVYLRIDDIKSVQVKKIRYANNYLKFPDISAHAYIMSKP